MTDEAKWYVAHTYSGYENKVKDNIEKTVENQGLQDIIMSVEVPTEDVVDKSGDKERIVKRKIYPGYVIIKMVMTEKSWYIVRNTRGVTGFVGPGSKPVPLSDAEVTKMGVETVRVKDMEFKTGDLVNIKSGPMEGFSGVVEDTDPEKRTVKVMVSMFNRKTPVEVDCSQVEIL